MIQRILEIVVGAIAALIGLRTLFSLPPGTFPTGSGVAQLASQLGEPAPPLAWLPVFLLLVVALAAIALGAFAHGVPSLFGKGVRARLAFPVAFPVAFPLAFIWAGRATLWLATAALIVLIYLATFNTSQHFIPSAALAIIASLLALLP